MSLAFADSDPAVRTKADVPTPALLVDLDRFEANLRAMSEHCRREGCHFRPHAKTHKCPEIARRQVAAGSLRDLGGDRRRGPGDGPRRPPRRPAHLADRRAGSRSPAWSSWPGSGGEILMAVGHPRQVDPLAEAAGASGRRASTSCSTSTSATTDSASQPGLAGAGAGPEDRRPASIAPDSGGCRLISGSPPTSEGFEARERTVALGGDGPGGRDSREAHQGGFRRRVSSPAGAPGTYNVDCSLPGPVELQSGSYVFMDVEYRAIGGRGDAAEVFAEFLNGA